MPRTDRRALLWGASSLLAGAGIAIPLRALYSEGKRSPEEEHGYGPLVRDPKRILDLPRGFRYEVLSRAGELMSDGFRVPGLHDGMAAFPGRNGSTLLVRNHELTPDNLKLSPFRDTERRPDGMYDRVGIAGTTTLEVDPEGRLVRHFLSLAGTVRNCAGGATPWGTWVSCEETVGTAERTFEHHGDEPVTVTARHGYNFEVDPKAGETVRAVPLREMGRFNHEAICVDPRTGIVYQTEDRKDGAVYRFRPRVPGRLAEGGALEALRIPSPGGKSVDTSNRKRSDFASGRPLPVEWVPISEPDPPRDLVRREAQERGAARFARAEGIHWSRGAAFIACTTGGPEERGQIWRLRPGPSPSEPDTLELFIEVGKRSPLQNPDNLCVSRAGELVICENRPKDPCLIGATPEGQLFRMAANRMNDSEFAGATFSPDGRILFVNIQKPGLTLAILGPWRGSGEAPGRE
jgi:secreted PhoX family phosphatase